MVSEARSGQAKREKEEGKGESKEDGRGSQTSVREWKIL